MDYLVQNQRSLIERAMMEVTKNGTAVSFVEMKNSKAGATRQDEPLYEKEMDKACTEPDSTGLGVSL